MHEPQVMQNSNNPEMIEHEGEVVEINNVIIRVKIRQTSACSKCHTSNKCGISESIEKIIDIENKEGMDFKAGDKVIVGILPSTGHKAVLFAYTIPSIIMITSLFIALKISNNELFAGACALLALMVYYLLIYCKRDQFKKSFVFYIKSKIFD